jgi:hypothetical protein
MTASRVSFTIDSGVLRAFNAMVPPGQRSRMIEKLMRRSLVERQTLEALADEFENHPDFAAARADSVAFDVTIADGPYG